MEKLEISAGEKKIQEYIERIKNGEDKNKLIQDLPPSFINAIEAGLNDNQSTFEEEVATGQEEIGENEDSKNEIAESIKDEILLSFEDMDKEVRYGRYKINIQNIDQVIKNGGGPLEVFSNGSRVDFEQLILTINENDADIAFIRKKDRTQNKGIGIDLYIELGRKLLENNICFHSSSTQFGPGRDLWIKLSKIGFAEKQGGTYVFKDKKEQSGEINNNYLLFNGAVTETIKHHIDDSYYAFEELKKMYFENKNTVSDRTVDTLAILGATTTPQDLIRLTRGNKDYLKQIIDDFSLAFNNIKHSN